VKRAALLVLAMLAMPTAARADTMQNEARGLMTVLAGWSLGSVAAGTVMATSEDRGVRFAGVQNLAWGAIDGAIAAYALATAEPEKPGARQSLARLFWINAALDVAYLATGIVLAATQDDARLTGSGAAIAIQGGFLLAFDTAGALVVSR